MTTSEDKTQMRSVPDVPLMNAVNVFIQSRVSQQKGPLNPLSLLRLGWVDRMTGTGRGEVAC